MSHPPTGPDPAIPPAGTPYTPGSAPVPGTVPPAGAGAPMPAGYEQPGYPSAPGYGGPAVAGPGLAETAVQPIYPGAPMSGAPLGQPMSAPPRSGVPYAPMPAAPGASGAGRGRAVLVLAVVAGLLFVLGGLMTGLFVAKSGELTETERTLTAQVTDRDSRLEANGEEIERLKRELQVANDRIKDVEQDLTGTKNDRDEQQRQKEIIAECLDLFSKAMTATTAAAFEKAIKEADKACTEAEKYL